MHLRLSDAAIGNKIARHSNVGLCFSQLSPTLACRRLASGRQDDANALLQHGILRWTFLGDGAVGAVGGTGWSAPWVLRGSFQLQFGEHQDFAEIFLSVARHCEPPLA